MLCCVGLTTASGVFGAQRLLPAVEVEEPIYTIEPPNNGSGPLWCNASTCIVRAGSDVYVSGLETLKDVQPLNNVRWLLFKRGAKGWELQQGDPKGRTREPCPLGVFPDGRLLLSVNPTLTDLSARNGPAEPQVLQFAAANPKGPGKTLLPAWEGTPAFSEHSYRSLAYDGANREMILFQNIGYTHAEWSFLDRTGKWSAQGKLKWPWGTEYEEPRAVRLCYPTVALKNRAVYWCGVSDIEEPNKTWRAAKKEITGQNWDYDFRRLFFAWCPDVTKGKFTEWVEIASREKTCGWLFPGDLWVAPDGAVHLLWSERALDERLRPKFFPDEKQTWSLNYAIIRDGKVTFRTTLAVGGEGASSEIPGSGRFQITADNRLFVFYYCSGKDGNGKALSENRVMEILPDGSHSDPVKVPLEHPFTSFQTASVRAGCAASNTLDVLGATTNQPGMSYARINLLNKILADFDVTVQKEATGSRVCLDATCSVSAVGKVVSWKWDLSGIPATGAKVEHTFGRGGRVGVTLMVRDNKGNEQKTSRTLMLPPAPVDFGLKEWGIPVRTESESFVNEGGGSIHVRTDKLAASAMSLSHWNTKGHWLEWEVDIPADGDYFMLVRYATPENATRSFLLDGNAQKPIPFPSTGGYGSEAMDNWGFATPRGNDGKPATVHLTKGKHVVRLENPDGTGLNLDYMDWVSKSGTVGAVGGGEGQIITEDGYRYLLPLRGGTTATRITAEIGHCFTVILGPHYLGDGVKDVPPSTLRLFEDGKELGPAHVAHVDIREKGQGRFSHWNTVVYFSASDNSDPRTNGRKYTWEIGGK